MKNHRFLTGAIICCGFGVVPSASYAVKAPPTVESALATTRQLDAIVRTDLNSCGSASAVAASGKVNTARIDPAAVIPAKSRKVFARGQIVRTLQGIWRGEVVGDAGDVHVDYFWIIDARKNEALIIAQRSGRVTIEQSSQLKNPPKLTYLMCAHDGYSPGTSTPQIHEFTKITNSIAGAADIVEKATGVKNTIANPTLTDLWNGLLKARYFDELKYVAYAGGLFKPMQLKMVPGADGVDQISLKWDAEYRGGGTTKLKYTTGVPMKGVEQTQFVGTNSSLGNYLVASPGNGNLWKVEVAAGGDYNLAFDKVTLGPLQQ